MDNESTDLLSRIESLRVFKQGCRRAPHKPLLLLYSMGQLQHGRRVLTFNDVDAALQPLLAAYAPPVKNRHQPELPYWHLATDGLWTVHNADDIERQAGGFPKMGALRASTAALPDQIADQLDNDPQIMRAVTKRLLNEHFAPSVHEDILNAVGLKIDGDGLAGEVLDTSRRRRRDPGFRDLVLRAYEHRCAFSGFQAALGGSYFGCEAAHVQWHSHEGPDSIANGIALEPTIHKLYDVGAWTLTDDRRIVVSAQFTGTDETIERIRGQHGKPLRSPLPGIPEVCADFIRWHREPDIGGVFRQPALPL